MPKICEKVERDLCILYKCNIYINIYTHTCVSVFVLELTGY